MFVGEITAPTPAHVKYLAEHMSRADVDEVWASGRSSPTEALMSCIQASRDPKVWVANGKPVCMFGVAYETFLAPEYGIPWLLGTNQIKGHSKLFLRYSRVWLRDQMRRHRQLKNYVDVRHKDAVRWLGWLGFELLPPVPIGPDHMPFHPFVMEA